MLAPIPRRLLTDTVQFFEQIGRDRYQNPITTNRTVYHCHIQNTNETRKTADNTEVVLRSVLFVDGRLSTPRVDFTATQAGCQAAGGVLTCKVIDKAGHETGPYTVLVVDAVPDDTGGIHHYELGLV